MPYSFSPSKTADRHLPICIQHLSKQWMVESLQNYRHSNKIYMHHCKPTYCKSYNAWNIIAEKSNQIYCISVNYIYIKNKQRNGDFYLERRFSSAFAAFSQLFRSFFFQLLLFFMADFQLFYLALDVGFFNFVQNTKLLENKEKLVYKSWQGYKSGQNTGFLIIYSRIKIPCPNSQFIAQS